MLIRLQTLCVLVSFHCLVAGLAKDAKSLQVFVATKISTDASWGQKVQKLYQDRIKVVANFRPSLRCDSRHLAVRDESAHANRCWGDELVTALMVPIFKCIDKEALVVIEPDLGQGDVLRYVGAKAQSDIFYCGGMLTFPSRKPCLEKIIRAFVDTSREQGPSGNILTNILRH